jgi:hypothetical protein
MGVDLAAETIPLVMVSDELGLRRRIRILREDCWGVVIL